MKIWRFSDPKDYRFAQAGRRGTWEKGQDGKSIRVPPLVIEWEPGSDIVGDFVWPGLGDEVVISETVARLLEERYKGFSLYPVEMTQEKRLYSLKGKLRKPRVLLPYKGPSLYDLTPNHFVDLDTEKSSVDIESDADGKAVYVALGVELFKSRYDRQANEVKYDHIKRGAGKGLFVNSVDLAGNDLFGIRELRGWVFCTDDLKVAIENCSFTNVRFLEMGDAY